MALSLRMSTSRFFCAHTNKSKILYRALSTSEPTLPSHADIVVVGGGIIGTSVAYHLAKLGTPVTSEYWQMLGALHKDCYCNVPTSAPDNPQTNSGKGQREVILLERDQLTSGTTWHAGQLQSFHDYFVAMRFFNHKLAKHAWVQHIIKVVRRVYYSTNLEVRLFAPRQLG